MRNRRERVGEVGRGTQVHLKKALAASESAEQRRRLTKLLDRLADDESTLLRCQRLVGVLQHLDTPAATELLHDWATTASDCLAEVAASALEKAKR